MAELADALDLGSSGESRAGSTPVIRIRFYQGSLRYVMNLFYCFKPLFIRVLKQSLDLWRFTTIYKNTLKKRLKVAPKVAPRVAPIDAWSGVLIN